VILGKIAWIITAIGGDLRWARVLGYTALGITLFLFSMQFDQWGYQLSKNWHTSESDWHRLLRILGYVPTWLVAATALLCHDWGKRHVIGIQNAISRGTLLIFSVIASGLLAELLKLTMRRERPGVHDGLYAFRPLFENTFSSSNLGLPSSHTAVAFGGLLMLARFWPRAGWICWLFAAGCGASRVLAGAHWVSDVVFAGIVVWPVVSSLMWWHQREVKRQGRVPWLCKP